MNSVQLPVLQHVKWPTISALVLLMGGLLAGGPLYAENLAPNPYSTVEGWGTLPADRQWGSTSAIYPTSDGQHIWVAERCGQNACEGSTLDSILKFDSSGSLVKSFGAGKINWPHGIHVDTEGNVWVTDARGVRDHRR